MAAKTTSQENAAGTLTGAELVRIVQDGSNARTTLAEVATFANPGVNVGILPYSALAADAALALAATDAAGRVTIIPVANNDAALPATYTGTLFEYNGNSNMRTTHVATVVGVARKKLKTQFEASHSGSQRTALMIEAQAIGSGANGPSNADYGHVVAVHKQGYAGVSSPTGGEINGLSVLVRQDGPKGLPSGDAGSSDASGILVNIQNVEDAGFTSAWEASTTNYNRTGAVIDFGIQTQIGVLDMNAVGAPKYGYVAVATTGVIDHAFYAAGTGGASFTNILEAPNAVRINNIGDYLAPNSFWANGAWSVTRSSPENGTTQIAHRGTGAMLLLAQDAGALQFGTNNTVRWVMDSSGQLRPETNLGQDLGTATRRVSQAWANTVNLGSTSSDGVIIRAGAGTPEGAVTANVGSLYLRTDGGAATSFYVKESGTGNTGWVGK